MIFLCACGISLVETQSLWIKLYFRSDNKYFGIIPKRIHSNLQLLEDITLQDASEKDFS